jgi:two-component system LytT family response regulator
MEERISVKSEGRIVLIRPQEICWIKAEGNYVRLYLGKESYLLRASLNMLENRLNPKDFLRIHRSTIINIHQIHEIQPWLHGSCQVTLHDRTKLMLSGTYRKKLNKVIGELWGVRSARKI